MGLLSKFVKFKFLKSIFDRFMASRRGSSASRRR